MSSPSPTGVFTDPYRTLAPPCTAESHHPTGKQRKTCMFPRCLFGLGEHKEGIWKDQKKYPCAALLKLSTPVIRDKTVPLGLRNLGATCYVGSLLQALFMNQAFRQTVLKWRCASPTGQETKSELQVSSLQRLFVELELSTAPFADPTDFARQLELQTGVQQDAQEFNKLLLTHLETSFSSPPSSQPSQPNDSTSSSSSSSSKTSLTSMFRGSLEYETQCAFCRTCSRRRAEFYELELQINGMKNVSQCLDAFTRAETLSGPNQYQCETCGVKRDATRRIVLKELPDVLSLQMMRFVFDATTLNKKKLKDAIEIPQSIALRNAEGQLEPYSLTAILYHRGNSAHVGHYVADVLDTAGTWWTFNDEFVQRMAAPPSADAEVVGATATTTTTTTTATSAGRSNSISSPYITSIKSLVQAGVLHPHEKLVVRSEYDGQELATGRITQSSISYEFTDGQGDVVVLDLPDVKDFYQSVMRHCHQGTHFNSNWLQFVYYKNDQLAHLLASMSGVGASSLMTSNAAIDVDEDDAVPAKSAPKRASGRPKKSVAQPATKRVKGQAGSGGETSSSPSAKSWSSKDAYMLVYQKTASLVANRSGDTAATISVVAPSLALTSSSTAALSSLPVVGGGDGGGGGDARQYAPQHMVDQVLVENEARAVRAVEVEQRRKASEQEIRRRQDTYRALFGDHAEDDDDDERYWIPTDWLASWVCGEPVKVAPALTETGKRPVATLAGGGATTTTSSNNHNKVIDLSLDDDNNNHDGSKPQQQQPATGVIDLVDNEDVLVPFDPSSLLFNPPIPNSSFLCQHGKVDPKKSMQMKLIGRRMWQALAKPGDLELKLSESACMLCTTQVIDTVAHAESEIQKLQELLDIIDQPVIDPVTGNGIVSKRAAAPPPPPRTNMRSGSSGGAARGKVGGDVAMKSSSRKVAASTSSSSQSVDVDGADSHTLVWVSREWLRIVKEDVKSRRHALLSEKEQVVNGSASKRMKKSITDHFPTATPSTTTIAAPPVAAGSTSSVITIDDSSPKQSSSSSTDGVVVLDTLSSSSATATTKLPDANSDIKCKHNRLSMAKKTSARAMTLRDWNELIKNVRDGYWQAGSTLFRCDEAQCADCENESRNMKDLTLETREYRNGLMKDATFGPLLKSLMSLRRSRDGFPHPSSMGGGNGGNNADVRRLARGKYAVVSRSWMESLRAFLNGTSPDADLQSPPNERSCQCEAHGLTVLPPDSYRFIMGGSSSGQFLDSETLDNELNGITSASRRQNGWDTVQTGDAVELLAETEWHSLVSFLRNVLKDHALHVEPTSWISLDDEGMVLNMEPALCETCQNVLVKEFENRSCVFSNKNIYVVRLSVGQGGAQASSLVGNFTATTTTSATSSAAAAGGGGGGNGATRSSTRSQHSTRSTGRNKSQAIEASSSDTIQELKLKIYQKCTGLRCQPMQIRLWYHGEEISMNDFSLEMIGIKRGDMVYFDTGGGSDEDGEDGWGFAEDAKMHRGVVETGFSGTALMRGGASGTGKGKSGSSSSSSSSAAEALSSSSTSNDVQHVYLNGNKPSQNDAEIVELY